MGGSLTIAEPYRVVGLAIFSDLLWLQISDDINEPNCPCIFLYIKTKEHRPIVIIGPYEFLVSESWGAITRSCTDGSHKYLYMRPLRSNGIQLMRRLATETGNRLLTGQTIRCIIQGMWDEEPQTNEYQCEA